MPGSLDKNLERAKQAERQVSRVDRITATTGPNIKSEIDAILNEGWNLIQIVRIGTNTFAIYTRPKRQR